MLNPIPSGAKLNYLCKGSNFTIQNWSRKSLENLSKTKVSASCEPVQDIYMLLHMWPTVWGVLKIILQCFKLFSSMLKLTPGGAKINYLCEGSNFTI